MAKASPKRRPAAVTAAAEASTETPGDTGQPPTELVKRIEGLEAREREAGRAVTYREMVDKTTLLEKRMLARRQSGGKHLWNLIKVVRTDSRDGKKAHREVRHEYWTDLDGGVDPKRVVSEWRQRNQSQYTGETEPYTAEIIRENARPEDWDQILHD